MVLLKEGRCLKLEKKFGTLRTIAMVYSVLALVFVVLTLLSCLGSVIATIVLFKDNVGMLLLFLLVGVVFTLVPGLVAAVLAKSASEITHLFLAVEENTRKAGIATEELYTFTEKINEIAENTRASAVILHHMNKTKEEPKNS